MPQHRPPQTVSLKWFLVLPWVAQILILSLSVGGLTHWHGRRLINRMASQLIAESAKSVEERFWSFTEKPFLHLQTHREALALGLLDLDNPGIVQRYFWQQLDMTEAIRSLYYGDENGNFLLVQTQPQLQLHLRNPLTDGQRQIFQLDPQGDPVQLLRSDSFDPRSRPWYWAARDAGNPAWSPIYVFAAEPVLGITAAVPFQTQTGTEGVLGIDLTLEQLSEFLRGLRVSEWGLAFIVEPDGSLVATSTSEPPFVSTPGGQERLSAYSSGDPLVRALAKFVKNNWGGFGQLDAPQQGSLRFNQDSYFLRVTQLEAEHGLSWYLVVALPQSYFLQSIWVNHIQSGLITLFFLAIGIQGLFVLYSRIQKTLKKLQEMIELLEMQSDGGSDESIYFREIDHLIKTSQKVNSNLRLAYEEQQLERSLALSVGMIATWQWEYPSQTSRQQWSPESFQLFGLDPKQACASRQTFFELVHPDDKAIVEQKLNQLLDQKEVCTGAYDFRILRQDNNQERWIRAWTRVLTDSAGQIIKILGANQDVTREKEQEAERLRILKELRISEARLRALIDSLPFAVWARDNDSRLILQNKVNAATYANQLGTTLEDCNIDPELKQKWHQVLERISRDEIVKIQTCETIHNKQVHFLRIFAPIKEGSEVIGVIGVNIDITEQITAERELRESEARFKALVENLPFSVWARDTQERLIFQNRVDRDYFGDLIGTTLDSFPMMESIKVKNRDLFKRLISNQETYKDEFSVFVNGEIRYMLYIIASILVEGKAIGIIGSAIDITEIKAAEMKAQELAAIVNSSNDAIISTDMTGKILTWNPGAEKIYGYTQAEMIGRGISQVATELQDLTEVCPIPYTAQHRHKMGHIIDVSINCSGLTEASSLEGAMSWIIRDISEQTKLAKLQEQFVSTVSHELRTPLTSIHGSLTAINSGVFGGLNPMGQELLSIAEQNTTRLIRLINDILDLEKLEQQQLPFHLQQCSSQSLIQQSCNLMMSLAHQSQIQLIQDLDSSEIWVDPDQIIQVLINLLSNAIKFSPPHSIVMIQSYSDGRYLTITVTDQGPGIPAEQLNAIFEPFRQVDASDSRKKGGSGLGLAISRQIILQHGGHIWAESQLGRGSRFFVQLPQG